MAVAVDVAVAVAVDVVVAVAVAGVIFIGHGQDHDHDDVYDYDHHPSLQLGGASFMERRLFQPPSALVAGLRTNTTPFLTARRRAITSPSSRE